MAQLEGLVIDPSATAGAALDLQAGVYSLEAFNPGIAQRRPNWLQGPEGGLLAEDPPYDDAVGEATIRIMPAVEGDMDGALAALGALTQKMQECSAFGPDGLSWLWTPALATNGSTMKVKLCEFDGPPPVDLNGELAGWFIQKPIVKIKFTRSPLLCRPEYTTWADDFSANTLANYTVDAGAAGNLAISSGTLNVTANPTVEERLAWTVATTAVPYPKLWGDLQAMVKFTVGTTVASFKAGVVLKRIAANSYLVAYIDDNGTNSRLRLDVVTAGVVVNRSSTNLAARIAVSTSYWIRARVEGSTVYLEYWTAAPTATGTPTLTASYALAGAEITSFGQGVQGYAGIDWIPQQTAAKLDDFTVEPNVWVFSNPLLTGTLPNIPGDADALGRLIATDRANQARRYLEWGLQQRYLAEEILANGGVAPPLQVDSGSLVTTGFAGSSTTRAGSFNANVIRATLATQPTAVCGTGNLKHIGSYRVRARVYASASGVRLRFSYQDGSGIFRALEYQAPPVSAGWADVDLGIVTIGKATSGTQQWSGRVEALSTTTGDTVDVDYVDLFPVERYAKARGQYSYTPGSLAGRDDFDTLTTGTVLNARVAPSGGTWATSGSVTDFVGGAGFAGYGQSAQRSTTSEAGNGRFAILGATNYTDSEITVRAGWSGNMMGRASVVLRYIDANNFLLGSINGTAGTLTITQTVAGVTTTLATVAYVVGGAAVYTLRFIAYASGSCILTLLDASGATALQSATGASSAVATGGALATGKPGINDLNTTATFAIRGYDNFVLSTPAPEPVVVNSGAATEIRSDAALRADVSGIYGPVPSYRGARFYLPPAGTANRTSRIAARSVRNDIDAGAYDNPSGDNFQARVAVTPRFLLPR